MSNLETQFKIFQKECQLAVDRMAKEIPDIDINQARQVWMFTKLAELQIQINSLNFKLKSTQRYE